MRSIAIAQTVLDPADHSFLTERYKGFFVFSHVSRSGKNRSEAQLQREDGTLRYCCYESATGEDTVKAVKRWIGANLRQFPTMCYLNRTEGEN